MEVSQPELVILAGVAMAIVKIVEVGLKYLWTYLNRTTEKSSNTDTKQEIQLAVFLERLTGFEKQLNHISGNELKHIQADIVDIKVMMAKVCTKLEINS